MVVKCVKRSETFEVNGGLRRMKERLNCKGRQPRVGRGGQAGGEVRQKGLEGS